MQRNRAHLLLHPLFLCCLFVLILNDHWWKHAFPGWITGKISDFAGIFMVAVLWRTISHRAIAGCVVIAGSFLYWKSPLAQPLIEWCNAVLYLPVARVIDYTDLAALLMLAPAFMIKPYLWRQTAVIQWLRIPVYCLIFLAMTATSMRYFYTSPEYLHFNDSFTIKQSKKELLQHLDHAGLSYRIDSFEYIPTYQSRFYLQDSSGAVTPVDSLTGMTLVQLTHRGEYYSIPSVVLGTDTVHNVHFKIVEQGKKTMVAFLSLKPPITLPQGYKDREKALKSYKKAFKTIIAGE